MSATSITLPFPTEEELEQLAARSAGSFGEVPFAALLRALWEHQRSCTLEIRRQRLRKRIVFDQGRPIACESNLAHERFGRFLVAIGRVGDGDIALAFGEALQREVDLEEVLIERGLLVRAELTKLRQQMLARQLLDGFSWSDGEFELRELTGGGWSELRVKVPQLLLTGTVRFTPQRDVDQVVMTAIGQRLVRHPAPRVEVEDLRLDKRQRELLARLDEPQQLSELATVDGLETDDVSRLVYAFGLLGLVVTEERRRLLEERAAGLAPPVLVAEEAAIEASPDAVASGAAAQRGKSDTAPIEVGVIPSPGSPDRLPSPAALARLFFNHRHQSPPELLELEGEVDLGAIEGHFVAFAERYAPWRYPEAESQQQAKAVFLAGARAYAALADEESRRSLLDRKRTVPIEVEPGDARLPRLETDLLDPEVQYREGHAFFVQGNYAQALPRLELAADCDPQQGLYRAEAAYCRFLIDPRQAEAVFTELDEACRVDPSCGDAFLYAGELAAVLGRFEHAESRLRRANRILAPDRRAIDKLRELKVWKEGSPR